MLIQMPKTRNPRVRVAMGVERVELRYAREKNFCRGSSYVAIFLKSVLTIQKRIVENKRGKLPAYRGVL